MRVINKTEEKHESSTVGSSGFTLIEVILAGTLMIILAIGILMVFSNVVERNRGENLRMQALSVLQKDVEHYRSLKFVPVGTSSELTGGTYPNIRTRTGEDGRVFVISVTIDNDPAMAGIQTSVEVAEADCKFKEIVIQAVPQIAESGWLSNLKTNVTVQRVRSN
ncbi:MAG: type II secretion system GspH family protein [Acidobacteriota bacterium]|nr:type II secretion system GspH family protein [Acidobacteriota bacterium]